MNAVVDLDVVTLSTTRSFVPDGYLHVPAQAFPGRQADAIQQQPCMSSSVSTFYRTNTPSRNIRASVIGVSKP